MTTIEKRMSFSRYDINRIYEWRLALVQGLGDTCCENCTLIEKRIKRFLGKDAQWLERRVKKYPYFPNLKREINLT